MFIMKWKLLELNISQTFSARKHQQIHSLLRFSRKGVIGITSVMTWVCLLCGFSSTAEPGLISIALFSACKLLLFILSSYIFRTLLKISKCILNPPKIFLWKNTHKIHLRHKGKHVKIMYGSEQMEQYRILLSPHSECVEWE